MGKSISKKDPKAVKALEDLSNVFKKVNCLATLCVVKQELEKALRSKRK